MTRPLAYTALAFAAILAGVYVLAKMGAAGWFTLTFAAVLVGVTILLFWPVLVAAAVGFALLRLAAWRARRQGARRWGP